MEGSGEVGQRFVSFRAGLLQEGSSDRDSSACYVGDYEGRTSASTYEDLPRGFGVVGGAWRSLLSEQVASV